MKSEIPAERWRRLLMDEFLRRREGNARYSLRAFARDLELNCASLSQVLSGKRTLSARNRARLADRLCLSPAERARLTVRATTDASPRFDDLAEDTFRVMSDWYYFGILNLARLPRNRADARWIASRLGISPVESRVAMERLVRMGFLRVSNGRLIRTAAPLATPTEVPSEAVRKFNKQLLSLAAVSIDRDGIDRRQTVSMTMAVDPARLAGAKELIVEFRNRLAEYLEAGPPREVYTLAIQLFPLTQPEQK